MTNSDPPVGRAPARGLGLRRRLLELRAPLEAAAYVVARPLLLRLHPPGEPQAVLVLPGGLGADGSTAVLRWGIRGQGYSVHGWNQGRNMGLDEKQLAGLLARVDELYDLHDAPITVIGWSLGGIYARMLARVVPEKIRQVITLGSPFRMLETDEFAHKPFGKGNWERFVARHAAEIDLLQVEEHERPPLTVPATSIYTRDDGFAPWYLSIDQTGPNSPNPRAENVEVRASHIGLASNPAVLAVILDRLAQPHGQWWPFKPVQGLKRFYPTPASWTHPAERNRRNDERDGEVRAHTQA
ncbi:esterase/lipase family protein [Mycobacterium sp.]|uniref:esterase/lipase family protein n=1 Tax=Mycobacterium sp. TaxID=1785 RepID=UPI003C729D30